MWISAVVAAVAVVEAVFELVSENNRTNLLLYFDEPYLNDFDAAVSLSNMSTNTFHFFAFICFEIFLLILGQSNKTKCL